MKPVPTANSIEVSDVTLFFALSSQRQRMLTNVGRARILRRALPYIAQRAIKLCGNPFAAPDAVQKTAKLFKALAEDYHEKKLEDTIIFPAWKQTMRGKQLDEMNDKSEEHRARAIR